MNHQRSRRRAPLPSPPLTLASIALVLTTTTGSTFADYPPQRETPIPSPGRSVAANDQSSAISTNPANLGFLPSSEARWTWVRTSEDSRVPARGHAFDFALALPWRMGTGLRLDFARPGGSWADYTWLTWAFGVAPTQAFSLGASVQHAYSDARARWADVDHPRGLRLALRRISRSPSWAAI